MDGRPIGIFDSGLGGLTAVRRLRALLPGEDLIYLGDTGRVPYGGRSTETLLRYASEDLRFLLAQGVKAVVVACGTVSSVALHTLQGQGIPVCGVVEPAARMAARLTQNGRVGILGTEAAIRAGAYEAAIRRLLPEAALAQAACPRFVPLIEAGRTDPADPALREAAAEYLAPIRALGADTLVLGCTHYPLAVDAIRAAVGEGVRLVDVAAAAVDELADALGQAGLLSPQPAAGALRCYVSGDAEGFGRAAAAFLGGSGFSVCSACIGAE